MQPPISSGTVYIKDPVDAWGAEKTIGLAELAVRNHAAAMPFDRRGDVLYWDDFESPTLKGVLEKSNRSTDTAAFGTFSAKCVTPATTGNTSTIYYDHFAFHTSKIGIQISFASVDDIYDIRWLGTYYDGVNLHYAGIRWTESTEKLAYINSAGVWTDLPGTYPYAATPWVGGYVTSWMTLKVVFDISTNKYVRLLFGNNEIDLSNYQMQLALDATKRKLHAYWTLTTQENVAKTLYFDNYILTENEP